MKNFTCTQKHTFYEDRKTVKINGFKPKQIKQYKS